MMNHSGISKASVAIGVAFLLVALAVAGLIWFRPDPCNFGTFKKSIGVDLGAQIAGENLIKTSVGLSDSESRDFDSILTDYAATFETTCRIHKQKAITDAEYNCRAAKMQNALNAVRALQLELDAAAKLSRDAQKAAAEQALADFRKLPRASDLTTCGASLSVDPTQIIFQGTDTEHVIHISNGGNAPSVFTLEAQNAALFVTPVTGPLDVGVSVPIELVRTRTAADPAVPIVLHIADNQQNTKDVSVTISADNARVYEDLAARALAAAKRQNRAPSVEDIHTVLATTHSFVNWDSAASDIVTAQIFAQAGQQKEAQKAVESAQIKSPTMNKNLVAKAVFK